MCLKTDTILVQYALHQFQYFITRCLFTVEIYQQMVQSNSFNGNEKLLTKMKIFKTINGNDLMVLLN